VSEIRQKLSPESSPCPAAGVDEMTGIGHLDERIVDETVLDERVVDETGTPAEANSFAAPATTSETRQPKADTRWARLLGGVNKDARNAAMALIDQGVVSFTTFLTAVILGRNFLDSEFGVYYLALTLVWAVRGIQEQIVASPYMVICHRKEGDQEARYAGSAFIHSATVSVIAVLALLVYALITLGSTPTAFTPVIWVLIAVAPAILLREHIRFVGLSHLRLKGVLLFDLSVLPLQIGGLLLLSHLDLLSVASALLVIGAACALPSIVWLASRIRPMQFDFAAVRADWRENWTLGRWALISHFVGSSTPYALPWILLATHGEAAAGILAACTSIIGLPRMFINGLANFLFPRSAHAFCKGGKRALRELLSRAAVVYVVGLGSFCLLMLAIGGPIMLFVFDGQYGDTGTILSVLAFAVLAKAIGNILGNGLWAIERPQATFAADVCATIVVLGLAFLLIGPLSVLGVAFSMLAGAFAGTVVRAVTFQRLFASIHQDPQPA